MGKLKLTYGIDGQVRPFDTQVEDCGQIPHVGISITWADAFQDFRKLSGFKVGDLDLVEAGKLFLTDLDLFEVFG
jgi:hypothetical protein